MSKDQWTLVDQYIEGLFVGADPALEAALEASTAASLPAIAVSPSQGKLLQILATSIGARRILEIGTLGGYSTIWMARALPPDGRLITLELEQKHADVARANVSRAGVSHLVDVRVGPALELLPSLGGDGPFDVIFIDADKGGYTEYLSWAIRLSRAGTLIIADNVVRDGKITDAASTDANVQGIRRFNDALAKERRVTATEIQTVGVKGYDGFAAIVVTG
jgi:predicted O-methyltransferase YrrM